MLDGELRQITRHRSPRIVGLAPWTIEQLKRLGPPKPKHTPGDPLDALVRRHLRRVEALE